MLIGCARARKVTISWVNKSRTADGFSTNFKDFFFNYLTKIFLFAKEL